MAGPSPAEFPKRWVSVAARRRGTSHARRGERCQDAVRVLHRGPFVIAAVADGAGGAARGGSGAAIAVRCLTALANAAMGFDTFHGSRASPRPEHGRPKRSQRMVSKSVAAIDDRTVRQWFNTVGDELAAIATRRGWQARDLATTAIVTLCDGVHTLVAHVGDGAAVVRTEDGRWDVASWPVVGPFAGTTEFVTDPDGPNVRIARASDVDAVAVFTDGLERLVLDFSSRTAPPAFFDRVMRPVEALDATGHSTALSGQLAAYLGGDAVTERTDDDVSLVLIARKIPRPGRPRFVGVGID